MNILEKITILLNKQLKKRVINNIRKECSLLGYSIDEYTDEQIEDGCKYMQRILSQTRISVTDFEDALKIVAKLGA